MTDGKAKKMANGPEPVKYFRVLRDAQFCAGPGDRAKLAAGSVISTLTHDVTAARRQGVQLERCDAPEIQPPVEVQGLTTVDVLPMPRLNETIASRPEDEDLVVGEGGEL